jgi:Helix-turn-helix domain
VSTSAHATLLDDRPRFAEEEWFSPTEIARKLGYATDKPVRKAIRRGELRAISAPCGRRLIVAESDLLRWLDRLTYKPATPAVAAPADPTPQKDARRRRRNMPSLSYDARRVAEA